jgi:hypothetical protein
MHGRKQFRSLLLNMISRPATAALAIAVIFALTVVLSPSAKAQTPEAGRGWTEKVLHSFNQNGTDGYLSLRRPDLRCRRQSLRHDHLWRHRFLL